MIVFDIRNGNILMSTDQSNVDYKKMLHHLGEDILSHLSCIDGYLENVDEYKVIGGELIKRDSVEINNFIKYGRFLSVEELAEKENAELLNKLIPTSKEIERAETTIEILSVLQEMI